MKKRISIILSLVLVACMLTAVFAFTASAEVALPQNEVVTTMYAYDFETDAPAVGGASSGKAVSSDTITNRDFMIVDPTAVEEETPETEQETPAPASEGGEDLEDGGEETPANTNKYGKIYATDTAKHGSAASVRYDIYPTENIQFAETNYVTFDIDISTENGYFDGGSTSIYFNTRIAGGGAAGGYERISISRFLNQWYINVGSGSYVVADNTEWFHLSVIVDVNPDTQQGYSDSVGYVFVNGVDTGLTYKAFGDASAYLSSIRINVDANTALASKERSVCFDNIVLNKVTASEEGDAGSLAWLMHNGKPLTEWHGNLYNDEYVMPTNLPTYDGMPKATWYYKIGDGGISEGNETGDALLSAISAKLTSTTETVEITLLEDIIINREIASTTTSNAFISFSDGGKKIINLNGHTLAYSTFATKDNRTTAWVGQYFNVALAAGKTPLELIINGADAEGNKGTMIKSTSRNDFFKETSGNKVACNYTVNDCIIDVSGSTFFSSGMGSDLTLNNCDLTLKATLKNADTIDTNNGVPTIAAKGTVIIDGCTFNYVAGNYSGGTGITCSGGVIEIKDSVFNNAIFDTLLKRSSGTVTVSNTVFCAVRGTNISGAVVLGEGVESNQAFPDAVVLADACYTTSVTESVPPETEGGEPTEVTTYKVMKVTLPAMYANLTLYSDFSYNLYIPTNAGITTVGGVDITTLPTETVYGVECYIYTVADVNVIEAADDIVITLVGTVADDTNASAYTAKKVVSILAYAKTVLESEDAEVMEGQTLVTDMLKYISEAYAYFTEANEEVNALLLGRTPTEYAPTETEVCNYLDLATYLKGAYISLDGNCPKYVLVANGAYKVSVTYTTFDGSTVTVDKTFTAADETLEIEMRAYDLYKTLTITAETVVEEGETPVSAVGEYNLYTYIQAVSTDTDADNDASLGLLKALYNFSKSAEAYKLG